MDKNFLHNKIKTSMLNDIESHALAQGARLPSETQLMQQFGVSRNTARRALDDLVKEGYARRIQGKGSFVEKSKIIQPLEDVKSLSELFSENGRTMSTRILSFGAVFAPPSVREKLGLSPTQKAICIYKLRCADGIPAVLNETFISFDRFYRLLGYDLQYISLYEYMQKKEHIFAAEIEESLSITYLSSEQAQHLEQKPGTPAFLLSGFTRDNTGQPFEVVNTVYRCDLFAFSVKLKKKL